MGEGLGGSTIWLTMGKAASVVKSKVLCLVSMSASGENVKALMLPQRKHNPAIEDAEG